MAADPTRVAIREAYAAFLVEARRPSEALAEYRKLLDIDPGNFVAADRALTLLLNELRRPREALELAEALALRNPDSSNALYLAAVARIANGQWAAARAALEQSLRLSEKANLPPPSTRFRNYYGSVLERLGDPIAAEREYRLAIQRAGEGLPEAQNNLAYLLAKQNHNLDEARELVEVALSATGPRPDFLDTLGVVYQALGQHARAVEQFQAASLLEPNSPAQIYVHLGDSQAALGDLPAAIATWKLALNRQPNDPILRERIHRASNP